MILARVVGELVATQKHESHEGRKLLLLEPETLAGGDAPLRATGMPAGALVALDSVGAGVGERVVAVLDGFAAMSAVGRPRSPIDAAVVGIAERVDIQP